MVHRDDARLQMSQCHWLIAQVFRGKSLLLMTDYSEEELLRQICGCIIGELPVVYERASRYEQVSAESSIAMLEY